MSDSILDQLASVIGEEQLFGLSRSLQRAYSYTANLAETEVPFATPNRHFLSGMVRYGAVDFFLADAAANGEIPGFEPKWISLTGTGGVYALELIGPGVSIIAHHVQSPDDPPRDSILRFEKRASNQLLLPGMTEGSSTPQIVSLTLVHGDKLGEFAFLRIYTDPQDLRHYQDFGTNIMQPILAMNDEETVPTVEVTLKGTSSSAATGT
jgi:hypothetical protein